MSTTNFILILSSVLLNASAQLFLKAGVNALGDLNLKGLVTTGLRILLEPYICSGLVCYIFSIAIWILALSKTEVSVAYPMLSIGYVVNILAARYLFGEVISLQKLFGIVVIILGVYLITRP